MSELIPDPWKGIESSRPCLPLRGEPCGTCPWCKAAPESDPVNAPAHYRWLPNGIEVIDITETLNFCLGNAIKYILRADHKGRPEEDIRKAVWYLQRELERRSRDNGNDSRVG